MYNSDEVEGDHGYRVGQGLLVHNASAGNPKNPNIQVDTAITSATRYRATDRIDPSFFIDIQLTTMSGKKYVQGAIETRRGSSSSSVPGIDFFAAMIAHFGPANIDGIHAYWSTGIQLDKNIDDFNTAVAQLGDTDTGRKTAALDHTWIGSRAKVYGFTEVDVYFRDPLSHPFLEVKVKFSRP